MLHMNSVILYYIATLPKISCEKTGNLSKIKQ